MTMAAKAIVLNDEEKKIETIRFDFKNPGEVKITVPVITCKNTKQKFFHPDDADQVFKRLQKEYDKQHQRLNS